MLGSDAAALTGAAALTASTPRRHTTVAGTVHPGCRATRHRTISHAACAGDRAGALMSSTLVPVSTSNEEHGGTIGKGADNRAAGNNGTSRIDLAASTNVTSHGTSVSRTTGGGGARVGCSVGWTAVTWQLTGRERARRVDEGGQVVDSRVLVVPERISGVA